MPAPTVVYASADAFAGPINGLHQTFTMTGTAVDDLIVLMGGHPFRTATSIGPLAESFSWTERFIDNVSSQAWGLWTAPITSGNVADTTVTGLGTANAQDGTAYTLHVLRGVDLSNPIAVISALTASRNPPSVVTPVNDCLVMACASCFAPDSAVATLAGYSSQAHTYANDTNDITVVSSVKAVAVAGTE